MAYKLQKRYRLPDFNYSQAGGYFVTICAKNKETYFGDIFNGHMELSKVGEIAQKIWLEIPNSFENVMIDEYVIMPNHIHGIIMITNNNRRNLIYQIQKNHQIQNKDKNLINQIPADFKSGIKKNPMAIKEITLGKIIRWFKGRVKFETNRNGFEHFAWQSRYYDRVIRNEKELTDIRQYIIDNPLKWEIDRNNPENLYM